MTKLHTLQTNFVTGQLDQTAQARSESALYKNGAAALRNCYPFVTGGVRTRPGTWHMAALAGPAVLSEFQFSISQSYVVAFSAGRADFFYTADGAPAGSITGCPWQANQLRELRFAQLADIMWVVHPDFYPVEIKRLSTNTWQQAPMVCDGVRGNPTYRYAPTTITCQAGGGTASQITLSSMPTVAGVAITLRPGTLGQARLTAGPGPWFPFNVTSVAGLVIGVSWVGRGLDTVVGLDVQFDSSTIPGTGGTAGGGGGGDGGSYGGGGDAATDSDSNQSDDGQSDNDSNDDSDDSDSDSSDSSDGDGAGAGDGGGDGGDGGE